MWPDVLIKFRFLAEEFKSFCKPTFLQSWQIPPSKFYCSPTWKVKSYFFCQVIHSKVFAEKNKETHNKIFNSVQSKSVPSPFMQTNAKTSSPSICQVWVSVAAFLFIWLKSELNPHYLVDTQVGCPSAQNAPASKEKKWKRIIKSNLICWTFPRFFAWCCRHWGELLLWMNCYQGE